MNQLASMILALGGGILLAMQGGLNAQLGVHLKNPLLASAVAYCFSTVFAWVILGISIKTIPSIDEVRAIPTHLWFLGALFSVIGISLYYYTIPKLGISTMISIGLFGQLIFSVIAGHFGWFNLPVEPISMKRIIGILALSSGIFLIKL